MRPIRVAGALCKPECRESFLRVCTPIPDPSPLNRGKGQCDHLDRTASGLTLRYLA
jgi:hypothetical protein